MTGRDKIMVYEGAFHSWIHGGKSAGPLDSPYEKVTAPYGDAGLLVAAIQAHAEDLAAVLIEPVMVNPLIYLKQVAPKAYLQKIRDACSDCAAAPSSSMK